MDPESLRAETPALQQCCYLNTGASGPSPRRVVEAADEFERYHQYDAPCGEGMYAAAGEALSQARERVASFLGTDAAHIAFTDSTAEGINHVAAGIDWEAGDVVVRTDLEHAAGDLPWQRARDRYGVEVRTLDTEQGRLDLDEVKEAVADARLLCLSSLTWNYGTRLPISDIVEIAHDAGTLVLVDAVQSPGQVQFDVEDWGADFVAASGHKWLLGLWGAGMFYVSDAGLDALSPDRIGYYSVTHDSDEGYEFHPDARRFELGTQSISPYVALETAIDTIEAVGMDTVEARIERLAGRLKDGLGERLLSPRDARSGLVTFEAEEPEALVERLAEQGIQIRWLPDPYACRVSVHVFNTEGDIDRLLDALE
jgi:cysteine desulfurase/selenocysteine lyase